MKIDFKIVFFLSRSTLKFGIGDLDNPKTLIFHVLFNVSKFKFIFDQNIGFVLGRVEREIDKFTKTYNASLQSVLAKSNSHMLHVLVASPLASDLQAIQTPVDPGVCDTISCTLEGYMCVVDKLQRWKASILPLPDDQHFNIIDGRFSSIEMYVFLIWAKHEISPSEALLNSGYPMGPKSVRIVADASSYSDAIDNGHFNPHSSKHAARTEGVKIILAAIRIIFEMYIVACRYEPGNDDDTVNRSELSALIKFYEAQTVELHAKMDMASKLRDLMYWRDASSAALHNLLNKAIEEPSN